MISPRSLLLRAAIPCLAALQLLQGQSDYSVEFAFRNYVPEVFHVIASRSGDTVRVSQAALWRRDNNSFPGLSDGIGVEFHWNRDKLSFGAALDAFGGLYAVDSNRATNAPALSDSSFDARIMTWGLHAKILWHLKAEHVSSVFIGAKAGLLFTGGGVSEWFNHHLAIPQERAPTFDRIPTVDFSPGLSFSLLAGLRVFLLERTIRPYGAGVRFTLEYAFATDTLPFRLGIWTGKGFSGFHPEPVYRFNAGGLLLSVSLFFTFTPRRAGLKGDPAP
jgi:hypothetical protein